MGRRLESRSARVRLGALLTDVLSGPDPAALPPTATVDPGVLALPELVQAAAYHRVGPALHVALASATGLPEPARQALRAEHHAQVFRHAAALGNLARVADVLDGLDCRWAVVKGPVLAERVHRRPDLRSYVDLDVLVDHRRLPDVVDALLADGALMLDRNWVLIRAGERAQTSLLLSMGLPLDLHWHLLNRGPIRRAYRLDMDGVLARSHRVPLGGRMVPVLDDVDALVHLCLHAVIAGASRLVWTHDVAMAVQRSAVDPDQLVRRTGESGTGLAVAVMLQRARTTLGAPVSDDLLDALAARRGWRAAIRAIDAWRPVAQNFGREGTGRTVVRATRAADLASLREFRHTAVRNALKHARRGAEVTGEEQDARIDPLREVGGTDSDRDAFFAAVATAREP